MSIRRPIPAALAVVIRERSVLLVRRANPPDAGLWGFPGGKIGSGELLAVAAVREVFEETGVRADAGPIFTAVDALEAAWHDIASLDDDLLVTSFGVSRVCG